MLEFVVQELSMRKLFAALSIAAAFVSFSAPGHAQETGMVVMQGVLATVPTGGSLGLVGADLHQANQMATMEAHRESRTVSVDGSDGRGDLIAFLVVGALVLGLLGMLCCKKPD